MTQGTLSIERIITNAIMANSHPCEGGYLMFISEDEVRAVSEQAAHAIRDSRPTPQSGLPALPERYGIVANLWSRGGQDGYTADQMRGYAIDAIMRDRLTPIRGVPISYQDPLRRLGEFLARTLDEDQWATAESMLNAMIDPAAAQSCTCGQLTTLGTVHRKNGPCFVYEARVGDGIIDKPEPAKETDYQILKRKHFNDLDKKEPYVGCPMDFYDGRCGPMPARVTAILTNNRVNVTVNYTPGAVGEVHYRDLPILDINTNSRQGLHLVFRAPSVRATVDEAINNLNTREATRNEMVKALLLAHDVLTAFVSHDRHTKAAEAVTTVLAKIARERTPE